MPVNHDVAWTIWLAQQVLAGRELYWDLIEINPPLVVWLNVPIVWIAELLNVSPHLLYYVALVLALFACAGFALRLLPVRPARAEILLAMVLGPLAGADFGQRDQYCVALLLPLLALAVRRRFTMGIHTRTEVAIGAGIFAGVAIAIKPFLAPIWLLLIPYRRPAAEDFGVLLAGALYLGSVALFASGYLPLTQELHEIYFAFNQQSWLTMFTHPTGAILLLIAACWWYLTRHEVFKSELVTVCLLGAAGSWIGAVVQRKGWSYHWYPAAAFIVLAVVASLQISRSGERKLSERVVPPTRVASYMVVAMSILVASRLFVALQAFSERQDTIELVQAVSRPGDEVLVLSGRVSDAWPAVPLAGSRWVARFPAVWFAQAAGAHTPDKMGKGERFLFGALVEGILSEPKWLIVETPELNGKRLRQSGFDVLAYLRQDPRAELALARYRQAGRIRGMAIWAHQ